MSASHFTSVWFFVMRNFDVRTFRSWANLRIFSWRRHRKTKLFRPLCRTTCPKKVWWSGRWRFFRQHRGTGGLRAGRLHPRRGSGPRSSLRGDPRGRVGQQRAGTQGRPGMMGRAGSWRRLQVQLSAPERRRTAGTAGPTEAGVARGRPVATHRGRRDTQWRRPRAAAWRTRAPLLPRAAPPAAGRGDELGRGNGRGRRRAAGPTGGAGRSSPIAAGTRRGGAARWRGSRKRRRRARPPPRPSSPLSLRPSAPPSLCPYALLPLRPFPLGDPGSRGPRVPGCPARLGLDSDLHGDFKLHKRCPTITAWAVKGAATGLRHRDGSSNHVTVTGSGHAWNMGGRLPGMNTFLAGHRLHHGI